MSILSNIHYFKYDSHGFDESKQKIHTNMPKAAIITKLGLQSLMGVGCVFLLIEMVAVAWTWPVVLVSALAFGLVAKSQYFSSIKNDNLIESFEIMVGGKDKFDKLPTLIFQKDAEPLWKLIQKIKWDDLTYPISRLTTEDGRNVVILKALHEEKYNPKDDGRVSAIVKRDHKAIFAYVEKISHSDLAKYDCITSFFGKIVQAFYSFNLSMGLNHNTFNGSYELFQYHQISGDISLKMMLDFANQYSKKSI
jgi:hypothetical protein